MAEDSFDISILEQDAELVALAVSPDALFGVFARTFRVPDGWRALVIGPEGERSVVGSGEEIVASDASEVVFVRARPIELTFQIDAASSSDAYLCDASVHLRLETSDRASDLAGTKEALLSSSDTADRGAVLSYLSEELRQAVVRWAKARKASDLIEGADPVGFAQAVEDAVGPACLKAGLRRSGELEARFVSTAYDVVRQDTEKAAVRRDRMELDRQLREAAEEARREHLEHVGTMLQRLREMADASPDVSIGELIREFGEDQRGQLYRGLLQASSDGGSCRSIIVAAGDELLWLDPASPREPTLRTRVAVPGGALRSVSLVKDPSAKDVLAVGGASAVVLVDPETGESLRHLVWPVESGSSLRGGVNSVTCIRGMLVASHSGLGLCEWPIEGDEEGTPVLADFTASARTVRAAQRDQAERLWVAVDDVVIRLDGEPGSACSATRYEGAGARIAALDVGEHCVCAGTQDGRVVCWSIEEPQACSTVFAGGSRPCASVAVTDAMGITRVGLSDGTVSVKETVLGETIMDRYQTGSDRLVGAWWSADRVIAVNDFRNQLFVWTRGRPEAPTGSADIGWLCSNQAKDVCLLLAS